jgi:RNA polymerase sigma-70 factor, ECF subfamily
MVNIASNQQLIYEALAQLPAELRALIRHSYYEGWTTTQIADDLHIAEDAVKSRLHYALRALLLTLQEKGVTR